MVAAPVLLTITADIDGMLDALDEAQIAIEPTPIWNDLVAKHGPAIVAAADDVVQAVADLHRHNGGAW